MSGNLYLREHGSNVLIDGNRLDAEFIADSSHYLWYKDFVYEYLPDLHWGHTSKSYTVDLSFGCPVGFSEAEGMVCVEITSNSVKGIYKGIAAADRKIWWSKVWKKFGVLLTPFKIIYYIVLGIVWVVEMFFGLIGGWLLTKFSKR